MFLPTISKINLTFCELCESRVVELQNQSPFDPRRGRRISKDAGPHHDDLKTVGRCTVRLVNSYTLQREQNEFPYYREHVDRCAIRNVVCMYFLCLVWRTYIRTAREREPLQFEAFNRYLIAIGDRGLHSLYTRLRRNVFSAPFDQTSPAYCARMYINWKALYQRDFFLVFVDVRMRYGY